MTRKRKSSVSAILTVTPVNPTLESEVKAHRKPAKSNKLFKSGNQETLQKLLQGRFKEMSHLKREITVNAFVLSVLTLTQCPEHPQSGSSALSVINEPTTVAPDLAIFMFA
jgi:hypothetical protein